VGLTDIVGIVVTIAPGSSLNGRLRIEGNQDTSIERFSRIQLYPTMNGARPTIPGVPFPENGWVNSDGTFRIDNVMPGEYRLVADSIKYYVKQARFGTIDLLKEPLQFAGREQGTIEVLLSSNFASIEGTVRDRFAPAKGTRVVLVPDKSRHRIELFKATVSDQNGRFSISNVAPGDYRLYAWEAIEPYGWFDPEVLKRDEQSAQPVHLNESVRQTIDPRLIAAP
jgi:hypothetical protein